LWLGAMVAIRSGLSGSGKFNHLLELAAQQVDMHSQMVKFFCKCQRHGNVGNFFFDLLEPTQILPQAFGCFTLMPFRIISTQF
jgi:hypothetical protein